MSIAYNRGLHDDTREDWSYHNTVLRKRPRRSIERKGTIFKRKTRPKINPAKCRWLCTYTPCQILACIYSSLYYRPRQRYGIPIPRTKPPLFGAKLSKIGTVTYFWYAASDEGGEEGKRKRKGRGEEREGEKKGKFLVKMPPGALGPSLRIFLSGFSDSLEIRTIIT